VKFSVEDRQNTCAKFANNPSKVYFAKDPPFDWLYNFIWSCHGNYSKLLSSFEITFFNNFLL